MPGEKYFYKENGGDASAENRIAEKCGDLLRLSVAGRRINSGKCMNYKK